MREREREGGRESYLWNASFAVSRFKKQPVQFQRYLDIAHPDASLTFWRLDPDLDSKQTPLTVVLDGIVDNPSL